MLEEILMHRCFQLAQQGLGRTRPNPLVGCVIVRDGRIVSEGYHQEIGHSHAERNAIMNCLRPGALAGATLYVNLEPCAHYGLTPPCATLVAKSEVRRVVVCNDDPNPSVDGRGYNIIRQAGIELTTHVLEQEGRFLNRRFFTFMEQGRPYIILRWAQTADGFMDIDRSAQNIPVMTEDRQKGTDIATPPHLQYWITNDPLKQLSHRWRTEEAAILVGSQTYINDRPQLTARLWCGNQPQRFVLDRRGRIAERAGWTMLRQPTLPDAMHYLHDQKIQSLLVEGGRTLLHAFIQEGLYDEIRLMQAPVLFHKGTKAPAIPLRTAKSLTQQTIGDNILTTYYY